MEGSDGLKVVFSVKKNHLYTLELKEFNNSSKYIVREKKRNPPFKNINMTFFSRALSQPRLLLPSNLRMIGNW